MMKFRFLQLLPAFAIILFLTRCKKSLTMPENNALPASNIAALQASYSAITTCDYNYDETVLTTNGWTKRFEDNFDGDLSQWNIWTGGAYNNELQYYQAPNLQLVNGILQIAARKDTVVGNVLPGNSSQSKFYYTSGRIESKMLISANTTTPRVRIVARIKAASGYGMWPAFWSYGQPYPTQGEIDYMELRGNEPYLYYTNYAYGKKNGTNLVNNAVGTITADQDLTACYHVYEMEWTKNALNSYLDGKLIESKTSGGYIPALFGKKQSITLNLAVGGSFFPGFDPAAIQTGTMYVDWVKVFTSK